MLSRFAQLPAPLEGCAELAPLLFVAAGRKKDDPRRAAYLGTLARNLACAKALDPVLDAFEQAKLDYQPLKGILFVDLLYESDPGIRPMSDVDLLLPASSLATAHDALLALGFEALGEHHLRFDKRFTHHNIYRRAPLVIELHFRLWHEIGLDSSPAAFFASRFEATFRGRKRLVARPELQMYQVLLHAATHGLVHTPLWMIDALLLQEKFSLDWPWIIELAGKSRGERALSAATRFVDRFFPGSLPVLPQACWRDRALDRLLEQVTLPSGSHPLSLLVRGLLTDRRRDVLKLFGDKVWLRTLEAFHLDGVRIHPFKTLK